MNVQVGDQVSANGREGTVRFVGQTKFAKGVWIGLELTEPEGKNDGEVKGERYFTCAPNYGSFVRPEAVTVLKSAASLADETAAATDAPTPATPEPAPATETPVDTPEPDSSEAELEAMRAEREAKRLENEKKREKLQSLLKKAEEKDSAPSPSPAAASPAPVASTPTPAAATPVAAAPATVVADPADKQEIERLNGEVERLTNELAASKDEFAAHKEAHKKSDQEVKAKLEVATMKVTQLTADVEKARGDAASARQAAKAGEASSAELEQLRDSIESLTIDKELAEETAENLQLDCDALKEKIELLEMDIEILQTEKEAAQEEQSAAVSSDVPSDQLGVQNEQLKTALTKLRDASLAERKDFQARIRELEKQAEKMTTLQARVEELEETVTKLDAAEAQITELKDQLDDAAAMETMVETVTEKNLALGEEVEELNAKINDLEEFKELSEEMELLSQETIKQGQEDLASKEAQLSELTIGLGEAEGLLQDKDKTLAQFRALVSRLQDELSVLKSKDASQDADASAAANTAQDLINENLSLHAKAQQVKALSIECDLMRLETLQHKRNHQFVLSLIPEGIFEFDLEGMQCLSVLERVRGKAKLLLSLINDRFHFDDALKMTASMADPDIEEDQPFFFNLAEHLNKVIMRVEHFDHAMRRADVELYGKLSRTHRDIKRIEVQLDLGFQLFMPGTGLRRDALLETLQEEAGLLERIVTSSVSAATMPVWQLLSIELHAIVSKILRSVIEVATLETLVSGDGSDRAIVVRFEMVRAEILRIQGRVTKMLGDIREQPMRQSTVVTKKILEISELQEQSATMITESLQSALSGDSAAIATVLDRIVPASAIPKEPTEGEEEEGGEEAAEATEDNDGGDDSEGPATVYSLVRAMQDAVSEISTVIDSGSMTNDDPSATAAVTPPWETRAAEHRTKLEQSATVTETLEATQAKVREQAAAAKRLEETLNDKDVRAAVLEQKLSKFREKVSRVDTLESQVKNLSDSAAQYDDAIEVLQADIQKLERENRVLKEQVKQHARRGGGGGKGASGTNNGTGDASGRSSRHTSGELGASAGAADAGDVSGVMSSLEVEGQILALRSAITHLRDENAKLRAKLVQVQLADLGDGSALAGASIPLPSEHREVVTRQVDEVTSLIKQIHSHTLMPRVVRLGKPIGSDGDGGKGESTHAHRQLEQSRQSFADLTSQVRVASARARAVLATTNRVRPRLTPQSGATTGAAGTLIGRVKFERDAAGPSARVDLSARDFANLHAVFAK